MRPLIVSFPLLAALPVLAQIHACPGTRTATFSDGDCPAVKAAVAPAPTSTGRDLAPSAAAVDAPLEIVETGVPVITQLAGRFAWLDGDTLAVTTFADPRAKAPWMVRRIVTFDARSHAVATLVPRGFLDCTNAAYNVVGLQIGDLQSRFAVASTAPPAVQQFQLWDPAARTLSPAPAEFKAAWHPGACLRPAPEDLAQHDLLGSRKPVRYLLPEHGTLGWGNLDDQGHPEGPSLRTTKKKIPLAISINDVSHDVRWLAWRRGYQIATGLHDRALDPPHDAPLVTMDLDGRLTRHAIPAGLVRQLDAAGATGHAEMIATRAGDLVVQPGAAANGGGLYLVQGEQARRVWCTARPAPGQAAGADACTMSQAVALSPDGCRIAFDARPANAPANGFPDAPTMKVITLCDAAKPTTTADASGRRRTGR